MSKVIRFLKETGFIIKETFLSWYEHDPFRSSAVISYYTIFSLPGLGVIIINLAGYFFGEEAMSNQLSAQIEQTIGSGAAQSVERIIANAYTYEGLTVSSVISFLTLLFGATGVFYQIQQALNLLWEVEPKPDRQWLKYLKDRFFSFSIILVIGFLLLVSLIASSLITAFSHWLNLSNELNFIFRLLDISLSLSIITLLFGAIYKILPDVEVQWKEVWVGALVTSLLFVIAKQLLGMYFGVSNPGSIYGTAGSIILIMLWTTYSALILLFGAEFTRIFARHKGTRIRPAEYAVSVHNE